jgi:hypothetical protein
MAPGIVPTRKVHFFVNSKGGVGKSHNAAMLVQYHHYKELPVKAFDADATSATFSSFSALDVTRISLMNSDAIDPRQFDLMLESILTEDVNFVVDTGASSFVEMNRYFLRNHIPSMIYEAGKTFVANIIIVGGATFNETSHNLETMASQMPPEVEIVVWLNEHFGPISQDGREFEDMRIYQAHRHRISGLVHMPDWTYTDPATFGADMRQMMKAGLTFDEARTSPDFTLMSKSRLHRLQHDIFYKLKGVI